MKIKTIQPMPKDEYWEMHMISPALGLLERPCHDCAITTGFYTPMADELLKETKEVQDKVVERWFCHNHSNKACRGCFNYIHVKRKQNAKLTTK